MEHDREIDSVMMNISRTGSGLVDVMVFSAKMSFALGTFLARLTEKGLVAKGVMDEFKAFHSKTGGAFTVYNVPLSEEKAETLRMMNELELKLQNERNPFAKMSVRNELKKLESCIPELEQLKSVGISFCALPKLNGSDQTIQVAVEKNDDQKFKTWFLNHLTSEMKGGQKSLEGIKVFTEGNYSILNMPFENANDLAVMLSDFEVYGINYAILPDLKVGDGYTQIAIPNSDRSQVEQWFSLWKNKALSEGREVKEIYAMNENSYASMGEVSQEEYIGMADRKYQDVQAEYEEKSTPVPWDQRIGKENSEAYIKYMQDDNYHKITINKESLVDNHIGNAATERFKKEFGYFISRIPNTYGENQQSLVIPAEQVFVTDDGKTYLAFLDKTKEYRKINANGKPAVFGKIGTDEIKEIYDRVERGFGKVEEIRSGKIITPNLDIKPAFLPGAPKF